MFSRISKSVLLPLIILVSTSLAGFFWGELSVFPLAMAVIYLTLYNASMRRDFYPRSESGVFFVGFVLSIFGGLMNDSNYTFSLGLMIGSTLLMLIRLNKEDSTGPRK